jgi:multiple sugar transport system substrate-binding protein
MYKKLRREGFMKRIISCIMFCFFAFLLMGCTKRGSNVPEDQTVKEKEKLVLWSYYEVDAQQESLDRLVYDFNLSQNSYEVSWEYVPMTDFTKKLSMGFTENELPDMVIIDNPDMYTYITFGLFEDITEYMRKEQELEDYYPGVISSVIYDDRYYGLPFCCNNVALYYNMDLFDQAGLEPPKTWEEFSEAARLLTKDNTYGFAMCALDSEEGAFQFLPWILSTGATATTVGSDDALRAYSLIDGLINDGALSGDCINWTQNDVARKFIAGEAAMMENGPWVLPMVMEAGINFGIVELPVDRQNMSVFGGENLAVIKGKNVEGAMAFLDYYSQEEVMLEICRTSDVIAPKRTLARDAYVDDPYYSVFVKQMDNGISRSSYPNWKMTSRILNEALYDVIVDDTLVQEISKRVAQEIEEADIE